MGIVNFGVPEDIVHELASLHSASVFVETGTYRGDTARWAAEHFDVVHTIEKSPSLYEQHSTALGQVNGVRTYFGDTRDILPQIINEIGTEHAVYWLDSHWTGCDDTAGQNDECPLLDELMCIPMPFKDIVLIDDARLFLSSPPKPFDPNQWPGLLDIFNVVMQSSERPYVQVIDDVIFLIPQVPALVKKLQAYSQQRADVFWANFSSLQKGSVKKKRFIKWNF